MGLDRQSIAKRDFPTSGGGYDRASVDAHLAAIAGEVAATADALSRRIDALEREAGKALGALRAEAQRLGAGAAPPVAPSALGVTVRETAGVVEEEVGEEPALAAVAEAPPERSADEVGARIVALEMAMGGRPREEIDRFLAENYELADRAGLLDDVCARALG